MSDLALDWQPSCSLALLQLRARLLQQIRQFFAERQVLEVETPLLCNAVGTDPHLDFFSTRYENPPQPHTLFLQTSPEFAMKRLLAAGSGSIFQICKAFRNGESGRYHNPEFTLLEWYRIGYDLTQLMDEIGALLMFLFEGSGLLNQVKRISYQSLFQQQTGLDPLVFSYESYCEYAENKGLADAKTLCRQNHADWLDLIFSHKIQPQLGQNTLWLVFDYPACFSSLAKVNPHNPLVVERVEIFFEGVELGNGYHELQDALEQEQRFDKELAIRQKNQRPLAVKDKRLISALAAGLPDCSGMAIGLDRLLMLLSGKPVIDEVLCFPISKA